MESHSLVTRMLNARYYYSGTLREAVIGNNPSYVWHSIMETRDLILSGSRIKVGS